MRYLEKITVFTKNWNGDKGIYDYGAEIFSASVFLRKNIKNSSGTAYTNKADIRIPKTSNADFAANLGDMVAIGEYTRKPEKVFTITSINDNKKGANPHWHLTVEY